MYEHFRICKKCKSILSFCSSIIIFVLYFMNNYSLHIIFLSIITDNIQPEFIKLITPEISFLNLHLF